MKYKNSLPLILSSVLCFIFLNLLIFGNLNFHQKRKSTEVKSYSTSNQKTNPILSFSEDIFNDSVRNAIEENRHVPYHIYGGVVPHDILAGNIQAEFFNILSEQDPKVIIVLGPNHYEVGGKFLSTKNDWESPFGIVQTNVSLVDRLVENTVVEINDKALAEDHSIGSLIPYIKTFSPNTQVVPILISGYSKSEEISQFVNILSNYVDENSLIISSVDFSHYLNSKQAKAKDEITIEAIKNFDYQEIFKFNNDHLDSPPAISALLMAMEKLGKTNIEVLNHTNSGDIFQDPYIETTSYFSIAFY